MENNKKEITRQDVHELVDSKALDPDISMTDLFRVVDGLKPNYNRALWRIFWIPLIFYCGSITGLLFSQIGSVLNRLSLIVFIIASFGGCYVLSKYEKKYWWVIVLDCMALFIIYTESLTMESAIKALMKLVGSFS